MRCITAAQLLSTKEGEQDGGDVEAGLQRVDEAGVGDWAARAVPRPSVQVLTLLLQHCLCSPSFNPISQIF